jgi:hypothetical protein
MRVLPVSPPGGAGPAPRTIVCLYPKKTAYFGTR